MNYEEFIGELQGQIQSKFLEHIEFLSKMVTLTNETVEGMILKFEDSEGMDITLYPKSLYEKYEGGISIPEMAEYFSKEISYALEHKPTMPEITVENARRCISFSLVNLDKNKELLEKCPYLKVFDMAAIPRWHISDKESFLVDNSILQKLKMTREELLKIAKKNTENGKFICKEMTQLMRDLMLSNGIEQGIVDEMIPMGKSPFYVISNENYFEGSSAILSNKFLQEVSDKLGCEELYIIPSSRHEIIVSDSNSSLDSQALKSIVQEVNSDSKVISTEDFLSNSIYKYNVKSFTFSICDSKGMFHNEKGNKKDNAKKDSGRGRKL